MKSCTLLILAFLGVGCVQDNNTCDRKEPETSEVTADCAIRSGDIIFQTSNSGQSLAIQLATNSRYSHVGIIFLKGTDTLVLEAVQPVQLCSFRQWVNRGDNGAYWIKRLRADMGTIDPQKMYASGKNYLGKDYDLLFEWGDDKLYCSELVYKLYLDNGTRLCGLRTLGSYDLEAGYVQNMLKKRYGINVPLDQEMVSPGDIFESDKLVEVNPCVIAPS